MSLKMSLKMLIQMILDTQIIYLIKKDDKISTEQMSKILEVSTRTIKRHIKEVG